VLTFVLALKAERGADCGVTGEPATRAAAVLLWGVAARGIPALMKFILIQQTPQAQQHGLLALFRLFRLLSLKA
jgi:hypothetical protein